MEGCRFTISDHRIRYVSLVPPEDREFGLPGFEAGITPIVVTGTEDKVVLRLRGNGIWAYEKSSGSGYQKHLTRGVVALPFRQDWKDSLVEWCGKGMQGLRLPKRKGQKINNHNMDPLHCGFSTFFDTTVFSERLAENDNVLVELFEGSWKGEEKDKNHRLTVEMVHHWAEVGAEELGFNKNDYNYHMSCSVRQSRFSTAIRERTAPHLEMSKEQHEEMIEKEGGCVHLYLPLCNEMMYIRVFQNRYDKKGVVIGLMPGTVTIIPSTALVENGRVTNIKGHRHLKITIKYFKNDKTHAATESRLLTATREYPHLEATMMAMKEAHGAQLPDDWEKDFRFISYWKIPSVSGSPTAPERLDFLESTASNTLNRWS